MAAALCRRGRFRVNCREVSLLPRHWDWLATQQGRASATLRRLVDEARKQSRQRDALRLAKDAGRLTADWPTDLNAHLARLLAIAKDAATAGRESAGTDPPLAGGLSLGERSEPGRPELPLFLDTTSTISYG